MNPTPRSNRIRIFGILLGLSVLWVGWNMVRTERSLRTYEKAFLQVEHPQATARIDSFDLEANYYPATYADDAIQSQSVYLVGELRSFAGDWQEVQAFYAGRTLQVGDSVTLPIRVLPVQIPSNAQNTTLEFPDDYSYGPFEYDMLYNIQLYYSSEGISIEETAGKFYLVYITTQP